MFEIKGKEKSSFTQVPMALEEKRLLKWLLPHLIWKPFSLTLPVLPDIMKKWRRLPLRY